MIEYSWADIDVNGVDAEDFAIAKARAEQWEKQYAGTPRVGDFVTFADGVVRQVSHAWAADWNADGIASYQTSEHGSFYFGGPGLFRFDAFVNEFGEGETQSAFISFSGGLYPGVKATTLRPMKGRRLGVVWFFHHNFPRAHSAVHWKLQMRRWRCSLTSDEVWKGGD